MSELTELYKLVGEVHGKMDGLVRGLDETKKDVRELVTKVDANILNTQTLKGKVATISSVMSAAVTLVGTFAWDKLTGKS